jgi:uridine kinase
LTERVRPLDDLLQTLHDRPRCASTVLVSVDGRGGSGKSTLARALEARDDTVTVIEFDDFYRPSATRLPPGEADIGGNFEWRRLRDQVLNPLRRDHAVRYQRYDWDNDEMAEWNTVGPGGIVIIEGNYSSRRELFPLYDFVIWVEAPFKDRLARGVARDGERARSRWLEEWMPEEERYLANEDPRARAHVLVQGAPRGSADLTAEFVELPCSLMLRRR